MTFRVLVDDNFHYMDEDERYALGSFPTAEAAGQIVDEYLISAHRPGMTSEELFGSYTLFGEDPFIVSESEEKVSFSAWDYAKQRCNEMCKPRKTRKQ